MPWKAPTTCSTPGCPEPSCLDSGKCEEHTRKRKQEGERKRNQARKKSKAVYATARWSRLRIQVLMDQPYCVGYEGVQCYQPSAEVDHIVPIEDGGEPYDRDNLQGLCKACHSKKTFDDVKRRRL